MVGLHWFSFLTNWLLFWLQCVGSLSQCNHAARSGNWRKKDMCISGETSRSMCISSCTLCWPESGILFFTWFSYKDCPSGHNWTLLNVILYIAVFWGSRFPLLLSLWSSCFHYIYYPSKKQSNNPQKAHVLDTSEYNIPEANPANPLPVSVLQRYPLEDHKDCRQGFWSTWPVDLGFWNMFFLRLHRVDRLVGDFHCPRDYIELMRLLSRKYTYRICVDYVICIWPQKTPIFACKCEITSYLNAFSSTCSCVAKAMSWRSSWEVLGGVLRSQIWLDLKRASLSMW